MIDIKNKTPDEIMAEKRLQYWAPHKGEKPEEKICKTYLIRKDGTRVNTNSLNENEILSLIEDDIKDYNATNGSYKINGNNYLDSFKLLELIGNSYTPSCNGILQLYQMKQQYGDIVTSVMNVLDDKFTSKARIIAEYQKECNGDFSPINDDDIIPIIQQMNINKMTKEKQSSIKR